MEVTITQYAIVAVMVFLAGFVDSIAGGGGLISLPTYLLIGVPPQYALGTNKMGSFWGTALSAWRFTKNGFINWKKAVFFAAAAMLGSGIGANLTLLLPEAIVGKIILVSLPVVAAIVIFDRKMGDDSRAGTIPERRQFRLTLLIALVIGMYDGFYGPGTGTFLILLLTEAARYTMKEASGITKAINGCSNAFALITFLIHGRVLLPLGIVAALCLIAGNYLGSGMVLNRGQKIVRPLMLVVIVIMFIRILTGN